MPRRSQESIDQIRDRLIRVAEHGADIDATLSTLQRLQIGEALRTEIRRQRVACARLVLRVLEAVDPDRLADDVRLDGLIGLPLCVKDASDGRGIGGEL